MWQTQLQRVLRFDSYALANFGKMIAWFTCHQLPSSVANSKIRYRISDTHEGCCTENNIHCIAFQASTMPSQRRRRSLCHVASKLRSYDSVSLLPTTSLTVTMALLEIGSIFGSYLLTVQTACTIVHRIFRRCR